MTERKETLFPAIPGAVSEKALKAFGNFERLGWFSLKNPDLQNLFLPKPDPDVYLLPHLSEEAVVNEIHEVIKVFKENERKVNAGEKIPPQKLLKHHFLFLGSMDVHIVVGQSYPTIRRYAPIPHKVSRVVIAEALRDPEVKITVDRFEAIIQSIYRRLKMNPEKQVNIVRDNLDVLYTLFGFNKKFERSPNGFYYFAPSQT